MADPVSVDDLRQSITSDMSVAEIQMLALDLLGPFQRELQELGLEPVIYQSEDRAVCFTLAVMVPANFDGVGE